VGSESSLLRNGMEDVDTYGLSEDSRYLYTQVTHHRADIAEARKKAMRLCDYAGSVSDGANVMFSAEAQHRRQKTSRKVFSSFPLRRRSCPGSSQMRIIAGVYSTRPGSQLVTAAAAENCRKIKNRITTRRPLTTVLLQLVSS
jgi:hypothetical protein